MGWLLGFQKNTSKNYKIYHPHWTPSQGWKWIESFTPHVTFNEDIMFGDMLSSIDQNKTKTYWSSENRFAEENKVSSFLVPQKDVQTRQFEGENIVNSSAPKVPDLPSINNKVEVSIPTSVKKSENQDPPAVPMLPTEMWPQAIQDNSLVRVDDSIVVQPVSHMNQPLGPPSSVGSESDSHQDYVDESDDQEYSPIEQGVVCHKDRSSSLEDTNERNTELIHQGEQLDLVATKDAQEERYDQIMTGWDPTPPVAGVKRSRSPEQEISYSKRGRPVKKVDYKKLHYGKVLKNSADPKTWLEAMESQDAKEWRRAVQEEFNSLKETGAIKIIDRNKLPRGRTLMKCKWVFKKEIPCRWDARKVSG